MMYRKQFVALAEEIKHHNRINPENAFDGMQLAALMRFLKAENPRFDAERWVGFIKGENGANGGRVKPAPKLKLEGGPNWERRNDQPQVA